MGPYSTGGATDWPRRGGCVPRWLCRVPRSSPGAGFGAGWGCPAARCHLSEMPSSGWRAPCCGITQNKQGFKSLPRPFLALCSLRRQNQPGQQPAAPCRPLPRAPRPAPRSAARRRPIYLEGAWALELAEAAHLLPQPRFLNPKVGRRPDSQPWGGSQDKVGAKDLYKQFPTRRVLFPCSPQKTAERHLGQGISSPD